MSRVHIGLALVERENDVDRMTVVSPDFSDDMRTEEKLGEVILNYKTKTYQFIPGPRAIEIALAPPHLFLALSSSQEAYDLMSKSQLGYSAFPHSAAINRYVMAYLNNVPGWERQQSAL